MKFLLGFLLSLISVVVFVLYTPYVTDAIKPYVEKEIEKQIHYDITVTSLDLHVNSFELQLLITPENSINIEGSYSPFSKELDASYVATLDNLVALKEHMNYELLGSAVITGSITHKAKHLQVNAHSNIYSGHINATYNNDELKADFSQLQSMKILKMLQYPEMLNSDLNGTLSYNMTMHTGTVKTQINNAHLAKNSTMDLLKKLSEFNIYDAKLNGTINSDINKNLITSTLELHSDNTSITSNKVLINSEENTINTDLHVIANKYPFDIKVSGNIKRPDVALDTKEVLKNELGRYLNHLLKELF